MEDHLACGVPPPVASRRRRSKMTVVKVEQEPALELASEDRAEELSPPLSFGEYEDEDDEEDEETDSEGYGGGGGPPPLKKGPWTPEEDKRLKDYVEAHGEGNWNQVQRNARLNRCGKSCRLRWANHLRPDLKKGPFDAEEVDKIIKFHIMWGNKWAKMASHVSATAPMLLQFPALIVFLALLITSSLVALH